MEISICYYYFFSNFLILKEIYLPVVLVFHLLGVLFFL